MAGPFDGYEWIDLSHTLEEEIPAYSTHARFGRTLYESYEYGDPARHHGLTMSEHTGTHMDAPLHFVSEGSAHYGTDEIPLDRLAGRAATIEATDLGAGDLLGVERIGAWEQEHGPIEAGDRVLIRYGWDRRWATGPEGRRFLESWPGLSGGAAEYLVEKGVPLVEGCPPSRVRYAGRRRHGLHGEPGPPRAARQRGLHRREPEQPGPAAAVLPLPRATAKDKGWFRLAREGRCARAARIAAERTHRPSG